MKEFVFQLLRLAAISFCFIGANLAVPAVKPLSQRGIIFPTDDRIDECFVDELRRVRGTCKELSQCPTAIERWDKQKIRPPTCYFNKFEHIVCCENEKEEPTADPFQEIHQLLTLRRRSENACDLSKGVKIAVVHGDPTEPQEFPYMAALGWRSNAGDQIIYRCGGALISAKFVLTAAHCIELGGEPPQVVRLGGVNLTDSSVMDANIKQYIIHPDYIATSSYNDVALIELEDMVSIDPVCVWSLPDVENHNVTAIGYGHTRFAGLSSNQLLKAPLLLISNDRCKNFYPPDMDMLQNGVASTHICAEDPEKLRDTCQGDSGGPILMKVERNEQMETYVVGITSFGQGCAGGPPGIYTRTSSYIDWIEDIVWPVQSGN